MKTALLFTGQRQEFVALKVIIAALFFVLSTKNVDAQQEQVSAAVKSAPINRQMVSQTIVAYGTLSPAADQIRHITLDHPGIIDEVWVHQGQRVHTGDKLVLVSPSPEGKEQYIQARSAVTLANEQLARVKRMLSETLATKADLAVAQRTLRDAMATLQSLEQKHLHLPSQTITAPRDGIVAQINAFKGDLQPQGSVIMSIVPTRQIVAKVGVEPAQVNSLTLKTPAIVYPVFEQDTQISGHIAHIGAIVNQDTHLVDVLITMPGENTQSLLIGTKVLVTFNLPQQQLILVPRNAVLKDDNGHYVYLSKDHTAHKVYLTKVLEQQNQTYIAGPLDDNDQLIVLGNYELHDGMTIRQAEQ